MVIICTSAVVVEEAILFSVLLLRDIPFGREKMPQGKKCFLLVLSLGNLLCDVYNNNVVSLASGKRCFGNCLYAFKLISNRASSHSTVSADWVSHELYCSEHRYCKSDNSWSSRGMVFCIQFEWLAAVISVWPTCPQGNTIFLFVVVFLL